MTDTFQQIIDNNPACTKFVEFFYVRPKRPMLNTLIKNTHLTKLYLYSAYLEIEDVLNIIENKKIVELALCDNIITNEDIPKLISKLDSIGSCEYLGISNNYVGYDGIMEIFKLRSLKFLSIGHIKGDKIRKDSLVEQENYHKIKDILTNIPPNIEHLEITQSGLIDEHAILLAENKTVQIMNLEKNYIGDIGTAALANNKTIKKLYLDFNNIGNKGAVAFKNNDTLELLSLRSNHLGIGGINSLLRNKIKKVKYHKW